MSASDTPFFLLFSSPFPSEPFNGYSRALPRQLLYHLVSHLTGTTAPFTPPPLIPSSLSLRRLRAGGEQEAFATVEISAGCRRRRVGGHGVTRRRAALPARPQTDLTATWLGGDRAVASDGEVMAATS